MMRDDKIKNLLIYFCQKSKAELSNARLTKLVYLSDWLSLLKNGKQITHIDWLFNRYGPYVNDIFDLVNEDKDTFEVKEEKNFYGAKKIAISLRKRKEYKKTEEISIANMVLKATEDKNFEKFIDFVYETPPVKNTERYSFLELSDFAKTHKEEGLRMFSL